MKLKQAIEWIAANDETGEDDVEALSNLISVLLVADLWGKEPLEIATKVLKKRKEKVT